eukprot:TRINITY_DN14793_c0_g1_i1.p1 TRINITY_DN14793_c0_g1~~TRINITY_DN14793_c0_g1_i1.p1  ORF type:complete len:542 (-),score=98.64 TRINITY_DN14793_c0_g1_i1:129-1754(-)
MEQGSFIHKQNTNEGIDIEIDPAAIKLGSELGGGSFGKVYRGVCYSKDVAIKVPQVQSLDREQLLSLRTEIKIMRNIPHPNIILFMGACTVPGNFMIVTERLDGDLEQLMKKKGKEMTVFERITLAKDAALGLNWLHKSSPAIIHRDLKTANLLYKKTGNFFNVKVCDFGLSAIKPRRILFLKDIKDGAKGTPLYMAPEVMLGRDFDEKADVYSYGICLWEIYTCIDPYSHHSDYDVFVKAICNNNERPIIPDDCDPGLKKLIEDCWHPIPQSRPDMSEVNDRLDQLLVDLAIPDLQGRKFWKSYSLKEHTVEWSTFANNLYNFLSLPLPRDEEDETVSPSKKRPLPETTPSDEIVNLRCLRNLVAKPEKPGGPRTVVTSTWFGQILEWFGPLDVPPANPHNNILTKMRNMSSQPWFHGDVDTAEAQRRIDGQPVGVYLVRFSNREPGAFTITRKTDGGVSNIRVGHRPGGGFSVNEESTYNTLEELLEFVKSPNILNLNQECPGSRFLMLSQSQQTRTMIGAYEPVASSKTTNKRRKKEG